MHRLLVVAAWLSCLVTIGECLPVQTPCEFRQPLTDVSFNFTSLIIPTTDYVLRNDITNETLKFQLCHELHDDCNGGTSAACLENGKEHISIGAYPPQRITENGSIIFRFSGDTCLKDRPYTLSVITHCDFSETDNKPFLFPYTKGQCDLFISWKTKLACGSPPKSVDCKIKNADGDVVDLSPLQSQVNNYVIKGTTNITSIILNVCHSVIPGYGAVCPSNSGICLRNESTSIMSYSNLGDVQPPQLINGTIALHYNEGKICDDGSADHSEATIYLICDFKSQNTFPVLTDSSGCHYKLLWKTAAACSDKQLEEYSRKTANPCKIRDPITNFEYDLEDLKRKEIIVKSSNESFKLSVCRPLTSKACEDNAGVCRSSNLTTFGLSNSQLLWSPAGPYLNYTNGSVCENGNRRYSIIQFTCSKEKETDPSKITITEELCSLKIQWPTPLVCAPMNYPPQSNEVSSTSPPTTAKVISTVAPQPTPKTTNEISNVNKSMTNHSITTDSLNEGKTAAASTSHGGLIAFFVILIAFGLVCGIYLANPVRRSNLYASCSSMFLRRTPARMAYSQEL
ncbi:cation-independent mannose-6-phosphate receptor isoform X2 [Fopius arisanus]|uniref:Cation-independent mannose-6-phosphate receptor isoform X2 n=1 Tax=Fopius arisanus TaxID=64838 RepID=A0A9R1U5M8_9HYME|nr:PREDICTED: cation-independent mannose-6-phosphate receptor isoform X2 [Fopius arisanus]